MVDEAAQEIFIREIEVTRALRHPNIVALLDFGRHERRLLLRARVLRRAAVPRRCARRHGGRVPLPAALRSPWTPCRASPRPTPPGSSTGTSSRTTSSSTTPGAARLADFGLAKSFQQAGLSGMTATGTVAGTYQFMAREQLTSYRQVRPATDVWSMAATIYYLLTGQYPRDFAPQSDPLAVVLRGGVVPVRDRDPSVPAGPRRPSSTARWTTSPRAASRPRRSSSRPSGECSGDGRDRLPRRPLPELRRLVRPRPREPRRPHGPLPALRRALPVHAAPRTAAPTVLEPASPPSRRHRAPTVADADVPAPTALEGGAAAPTVAEDDALAPTRAESRPEPPRPRPPASPGATATWSSASTR